VLSGRDVLGCAQTGTGKTAAFALPIAQLLMTRGHAPAPADQGKHGARGRRPIRALILTPTRELALQIAENLAIYAKHTHLRHATIFGGVSQHQQVLALNNGIDIAIATPGRLEDLMQQGYVDLSKVEIFVLDEADRMLDMGFIQPIKRIAGKVPAQRQTLLFSATMPKEIRHLAHALLRDPATVEVQSVSSTPTIIEQSVYHTHRDQKPSLLAHLLQSGDLSRTLVFTRTKHGADKVVKRLSYSGITAEAIHGNKRQNVRQRTLANFKSGRTSVLVATDIAARGIDVDDVTHVINYELPNEPETYVHRIGRTGRNGNAGQAIAFCDHDERGFLRAIERLTKTPIRVEATPELAAAPQPERHDSTDDDRSRPVVREFNSGRSRNPFNRSAARDERGPWRSDDRSRPRFEDRPERRSDQGMDRRDDQRSDARPPHRGDRRDDARPRRDDRDLSGPTSRPGAAREPRPGSNPPHARGAHPQFARAARPTTGSNSHTPISGRARSQDGPRGGARPNAASSSQPMSSKKPHRKGPRPMRPAK
jgi:ATP-dependent RNA helicase RhlE